MYLFPKVGASGQVFQGPSAVVKYNEHISINQVLFFISETSQTENRGSYVAGQKHFQSYWESWKLSL